METLENRRVLAAAVLNEIQADGAGGDPPYEFIEIKGVPGESAANLYFVSIEGDNPVFGIPDFVVDLSGASFGSNGLIVIKAEGGYPAAAGTTVVIDETLEESGRLENGSNTFALIYSPTPIVEGPDNDLDANNDGILELPEGAFVVDAAGWSDGDGTDLIYGAVLSGGGNPAGVATRFRNDNRANTADAWYFGERSGTPEETTYSADPSLRSANFPEGGVLTPGDVNAPGSNAAPVGSPDAFQVEPGSTLTVAAGAGVLSNDSDADGLNSLLFGDLITGPTLGTLVFNEDGSFQYVSNGTAGSDSFTYRASDLEAFSDLVTVTIDVQVSTNVAPTLTTSMGPFSYIEDGGPIAIAPGAVVSDADSADFSNGFVEVAVTNASAGDVLSILSTGTAAGQISESMGVVQYGGTTIGFSNGGNGAMPLRIDLNADASVEAVQALVRSIQFAVNSDTPDTTDRIVRFVVNDGDGDSSTPRDVEVSVAATNDSPTLVLSREDNNFVRGDGATTIDGLVDIQDADLSLENGTLTVSITANAAAGDALFVRNSGTGPGQVGIAGDVVSYGGTPVGSVAGGDGGAALVITFNSAASIDAVEAVARAVAFDTTDTRKIAPARTVTFTIDDAQGGNASDSLLLSQQFVRQYAFQEGVDAGRGTYTGAVDIQLHEPNPDTPQPVGAVPGEGLLVDFDGGTSNSQVLLRFDNIFGSEPGQIPLGAQIVGARVIVETNNPGDGGTFHRMLTPFDSESDTWNTFGNGTAGRNNLPAVQTDDIEARSGFESQIGVAAGNSDARAGKTVIGVTDDIQAWANGEANHGWLLEGWEGRSDGWTFFASEYEIVSQRPRLEIEWLPADTTSRSFREGDDFYTGTGDTRLLGNSPDEESSEVGGVFVDAPDANSDNTSQVLLRFSSIFGNAEAGRIPAGSLIYAASLDLASVNSNAQGDGGTFHRMLTDWAETATWNTFGNGIQTDGVEASPVVTETAGEPQIGVKQQAGYNTFDVTADLQAWVNGESPNYGWAILPYDGLRDGWGINLSEAADPVNRPQLRVYFAAPGVSVLPTTGLSTDEQGDTAQFVVSLDTPPTADVTIAVSSTDAGEGVANVTELVFTPANWQQPQIVTVTGINDATVDGDQSYQILLGAAVSTDVNYSGIDPADVTLTNVDNGSQTIAPPQVDNVQFGDGTNQRSTVRSIRVDFDSVVTADPGAFVLERRVGGAFEAIPASELVIDFTSLQVGGGSQFTLTFSGSSVIGGSLADGNYRLTILGDRVRAGAQDLDGDNDGVAGGNFVRGEEATDNFFRLFGDSNGSGGVNLQDFNALRLTYGRTAAAPEYNAAFDFDGMNGVNLPDFNQFRSRYNQSRNF